MLDPNRKLDLNKDEEIMAFALHAYNSAMASPLRKMPPFGLIQQPDDSMDVAVFPEFNTDQQKETTFRNLRVISAQKNAKTVVFFSMMWVSVDAGTEEDLAALPRARDNPNKKLALSVTIERVGEKPKWCFARIGDKGQVGEWAVTEGGSLGGIASHLHPQSLNNGKANA